MPFNSSVGAVAHKFAGKDLKACSARPLMQPKATQIRAAPAATFVPVITIKEVFLKEPNNVC